MYSVFKYALRIAISNVFKYNHAEVFCICSSMHFFTYFVRPSSLTYSVCISAVFFLFRPNGPLNASSVNRNSLCFEGKSAYKIGRIWVLTESLYGTIVARFIFFLPFFIRLRSQNHAAQRHSHSDRITKYSVLKKGEPALRVLLMSARGPSTKPAAERFLDGAGKERTKESAPPAQYGAAPDDGE